MDRLGVFAAPTEAFHGLAFPPESDVTINPDRTLHEARKYARLALSGNPTAMELMWLPGYEIRTELGEELIRSTTSGHSSPGAGGDHSGPWVGAVPAPGRLRL